MSTGDEVNSDLQKGITNEQMETDEGPLINENSNGLSHLLTEGEFNSVDAVGVDESSTSNHGFLNAVELSTGSVGDYLENNSGFNADSFDVGDNAVTFPNDSMNNVLSDGDSHLSDTMYKAVDKVSKKIGTIEHSEINSIEAKRSPEVDKKIMSKGAGKHLEMQKLLDHNTKKSVNITENNVGTDTNVNREFDPTDVIPQKDTMEVGCAEETEVVSEDELPTVQKPSVKDAENVSDDELPGPKPAELPADTEVVSEDELPSSKKEGKETRKRKTENDKDDYDPGSPTSENETSKKKQAVVKNGESKPVPAEKRSSIDEKPKKKTLPELDKYWKVVNDDPTDFTGWTYLLQYVDQESDVEAAREAYDAFLSHYPYCYGYWRKYADYEKRKGSKKKCLEVLERGLKSIPLSVDLWIHYLNHIKTIKTEDHIYIRAQYERAIETCGLEFRSDRLWESYIKWEAENGSALNVTNIYDRLLATPTLGYTAHLDNFQEHVMSEPVTGVISREELVRLRSEVRATTGAPAQLDLPPGEDEPQDHVASEEEAQAIKERIIAARRKVHKITGEEVASRWTFEEGIKRPYFHVKPLERCQLKNWKAYLDWEKQHGSLKRALVLHERCLIACALYEEFWMRLVKFLEERSETEPELIAVEREVLERACTVHHLDKPELHIHWANFEEEQGNVIKAAEILDRIEKTCPNVVQIQYKRINLERRRGDYEKCAQLYEMYISTAKSKPIASALSIRYARFLFHVKQDHAAAKKALDDAVTKDPLNVKLHMQRLDLALHIPGTPYSQLEELALSYSRQPGAETEASASMAWRARQLADELGDAAAARRAAAHARSLTKLLRKRTRAARHEPPPAPPAATPSTINDSTKKKESTTVVSNTVPANTGYYPAGGAGQYDQQYQQPYQQPPWGYQQPPGPYQHHPHPWPQYPNYY